MRWWCVWIGGWMISCVGTLLAHAHPAPGHVALSADFLYLLPSVDYTYYIVDSPLPLSNGLYETTASFPNNDFNFVPGFRVGGIYSFCGSDRELEGYYSRLSVKHSSSTSGKFLEVVVPTFGLADFEGQAGTAFTSLDLLYQRAELWVTHHAVINYCDLNIDLLAGAEFAYIRLNETLNLITTDGSPPAFVQAQSKTWGVGPQLGAEFDYQICSFSLCNSPSALSFCGFTSGSILTSKLMRTMPEDLVLNGSSPPLATGPFDFEDTWKLIPALHARLGLNYATNFSCFGASLEVGYEYHLYLKALNRHSFNFVGFVAALATDFDVQGLYVSCAVIF